MRKIHIEVDLETEELQPLSRLKEQIIAKIISVFFVSCKITNVQIGEKYESNQHQT